MKVRIDRITETTSELAKNPHVVKLVNEEIIKHAFGSSKRTKTYYISCDAGDIKEGDEMEFDLNTFDVRRTPFTFVDADGVEQHGEADWLQPKMSV